MHKKYRRQDRDPGWLGLIVPRCAVTCIGYILRCRLLRYLYKCKNH